MERLAVLYACERLSDDGTCWLGGPRSARSRGGIPASGTPGAVRWWLYYLPAAVLSIVVGT
jgi:hypothetical protein